MAQNCSSDINLVMNYIDQVAKNGTTEDQQQLKEKFGFGDLEHLEDMAS